jgi:hypothetical protein
MGEFELRVSDLDRDRAAAVLHNAIADGRLDWTEHSERLAAVYAARTEAELAPMLRDLPPVERPMVSSGTAFPAFPASSAGPLRVTLGKVRRSAEPNTSQQVQVTLGAAVIDLRGLPPGCTVEVTADSLLGKVEVYVSPGTRLIDTGTALLGKRSTIERGRGDRRTPVRPGAPVVRLGGHSVLGHVRVTIG